MRVRAQSQTNHESRITNHVSRITLQSSRTLIMTRDAEISEKTGRLVELMATEDLGGILLNARHNFSWLTCGGSNGIDQSREAGAGWLFVRRDAQRYVLSNRIEMPRLLEEELDGQGYEPVEFSWEDEKANPAIVTERARSLLKDHKAVACDLSAAGCDRVIEAELSRARGPLTQSEIDRYRALGRDAGEAIGRMTRSLEPGLTEIEIARRASDALAACGAQSVVSLVATDGRLAKFRHPVPTERRWEKSVMVVACARRGGLTVSLTRIVCSGTAPDELARRTEACARVNAQLFAATRPGVKGSDLYLVTSRGYSREGFQGEEHLHHQGGATGYRTRDWVAHPQSQDRVQLRQAFAWNPSITGTKTEETCIAFEDDVEVISASPGWPGIPVEAAGRKYVLPGILAL
jgi:antitoxin VapB